MSIFKGGVAFCTTLPATFWHLALVAYVHTCYILAIPQTNTVCYNTREVIIYMFGGKMVTCLTAAARIILWGSV